MLNVSIHACGMYYDEGSYNSRLSLHYLAGTTGLFDVEHKARRTIHDTLQTFYAAATAAAAAPDTWTLGEPVAITVTLENEEGAALDVRTRSIMYYHLGSRQQSTII